MPFLEQQDIVLTTYSILTGERSMRNGLLKAMHCVPHHCNGLLAESYLSS